MQKGIECKCCKEYFQYDLEDCFYIENSSGYSTKLINCPHCGAITILQTWIDYHSLTCVNDDPRYYEYSEDVNNYRKTRRRLE